MYYASQYNYVINYLYNFRNPTPVNEPQLWPTLTPLIGNNSEYFRYLNITGAATSLGTNENITLVVKEGYLTERMNFMDSLNLSESVHQVPRAEIS